MNTNIKRRLLALILFLSIVISMLSVFSYANTNTEQTDEETYEDATIVYNRGFGEGWNYDNGLSELVRGGANFAINYVKRSASNYDYFLTVELTDGSESYLELDAGESVPTEGKEYIVFDFYAPTGIDAGGAVVATTAGNAFEREYLYILAFSEGDIYVLGERVGKADDAWHHVAIELDFDYAGDTESEYKINVFYDAGSADTYRELDFVKSAAVPGISSLRIGASADSERTTKQSYALDNIELYYGTDGFVDLDGASYGTAVNESAPRNFDVKGYASNNENHLSGTPVLERDSVMNDVEIVVNRHFGEGWDYNNGFRVNERGQLFTLRTDYDYDTNKSNNYANHYLHVELQNPESGSAGHGFLFVSQTTSESTFSDRREGKFFLEFDMKTHEDINTGGIELRFAKGSASFMNLSNGKLTLLGEQVGDIGPSWLHIACEFDLDYGRRELSTAKETVNAIKVTIYYGSRGESVSRVFVDTPNDEGTGLKIDASYVSTFRFWIGMSNAQHIGQWWAMDNFQLYFADCFKNLPTNSYGTLVDAEKTPEVDLGNGAGNVSIEQIYKESITMKVGSEYCLLNDQRQPLFTTSDGVAYGAPVKVNGRVMVPLIPLTSYMNATVWSPDGTDNVLEILAQDTLVRLTLGSKTVLLDGERYSLSAAPAVYGEGDERYLVIALDDVEAIFPGIYVTWDNMGVFTVGEYDEFINRDQNGAIDMLVDVMRKFVFDDTKAQYDAGDTDAIYNMVEETTGFDHPYLFATQDEFDRLREIYNSKPGDELFDPTHIQYIDEIVRMGKSLYLGETKFQFTPGYYITADSPCGIALNSDGRKGIVARFDEGGRYAGLNIDPVNPYMNAGNGGHDPQGGRLNVIYTGYMMGNFHYMAFAVQMTEDYELAAFVLDWAVEFCEWEHWGAGHFLNPSESSYKLAIAYDWCYDMWMEISPEKTAFVAQGLYNNAIHDGYVVSNALPLEHYRSGGHAVRYNRTPNNWNAVCASAMIIDTLAVFDTLEGKALEEAKWLVADNIISCTRYSMNYFAPDGSYPESAGYGNATMTCYLEMTAALMSTTGKDFGLLDIWGLDTFYTFTTNVTMPGVLSWPYHDDSVGEVEAQMLFFYAGLANNKGLAEYKKQQIENGHSIDLWDAIYFFDTEKSDVAEMPLSYYIEGLDGFTVRSSWDTDALFVGIMGEANDFAHTQIDSGNWVYTNKQIFWFVDLGMENYNAVSYLSNPLAYRKSAEGHNTFIVTDKPNSIPSGQLYSGNGKLIDYMTTEYGAYAIIDNTSCYASTVVESAYRGIFVTNDYKTVVIQDEVEFKSVTSSAWIAHYQDIMSGPLRGHFGVVSNVTIDPYTLATAYLEGLNPAGEKFTLRVSLVHKMRGVNFKKMDAGVRDFLLEKTIRPEDAIVPGKSGWQDPETSRTAYKRLVVDVGGQMNVKMAVVIEIVDSMDSALDVGYKLTDMKDWVPYADTRDYNAATVEKQEATQKRSTLKSNIHQYASALSSFDKGGLLFTDYFESFYTMLGNIEFLVAKYGRDTFTGTLANDVSTYDLYRAKYDGFVKNARAVVDGSHLITRSLIGLK